MKSIRRWVEEDAGISLGITSLTSYISRLRRRERSNRRIEASPMQSNRDQTMAEPVLAPVSARPTVASPPRTNHSLLPSEDPLAPGRSPLSEYAITSQIAGQHAAVVRSPGQFSRAGTETEGVAVSVRPSRRKQTYLRKRRLIMQNFLTEREVAKQIRVSLASLRRWRLLQRGPRFIKAGALVRYRPEDLEQWMENFPSEVGIGMNGAMSNPLAYIILIV